MTEIFEKCILESGLWELLGYQIDSFNLENSIEFQICCKKTGRIIEDLGDSEEIGFLNRLDLTFSFISELPFQIMDLLTVFNYLTGSLILNLERIYPLVFSYYGRLFFCLNFEYFKQNLSLIQQLPITEPDIPSDIYLHNLIQLIKIAMESFNSINIMKSNKLKTYRLKDTPKETFENLDQLLHCLTFIDPELFKSLIVQTFEIVSLSDHNEVS